ncbi:helix-turn-helix transcriptional regulator [Oculatella sp. LEGE 06141]|nr:helix-turn-helix transcriptional regulator [Oculatella sp. LEGE 06141]MBE9178644.1 helix-turn-helix transcriptional regulator [Oculatella sp. LEGE 06141]
MQENNLSGRQLARRLGVSQPSALAYLDAVTYPSQETRESIAPVLNMTPVELESYLDDIPVQPQKLLDEVLQEIRAMGRDDFSEVARVVFDRLLDERKAVT